MAPTDTDHVAQAEPTAPAQVSGPVANWRDFFIQLIIVTAGVLIALLLEGLVGWRSDRELVREARANIRQELQDNLKEIDGEIAGFDAREKHLNNALQLSEELLATAKTDIKQIDLGFSLTELNSASWRSAERTGALALMEYRHVKALSQLYDFQDLFISGNRQTLGRLSGALTGMTRDPTRASREDLQAFRHEVLALQAALLIEAQLAKQLSRAYKTTLAEVFE